MGGLLANRQGRKGAIVINAWIFAAGGLLLCLAPNVLWLTPARLVIGFASGLSTVVVPVYLGEMAPPTLRGMLGTCTQFAMVLGILAADLLAVPLATTNGWRYLFGVTPLLGAVQVRSMGVHVHVHVLFVCLFLFFLSFFWGELD
jgi:MFS transporter, SP family, solute carrier family 2 (facilitated glucose transporter), member 3